MKNKPVLLFCLLSVPFLAQVASAAVAAGTNIIAVTNGPVYTVNTPPAAVPGTGMSLWLALVPILTPIIITVLKWAVPKIPAVALPLAAPLLGIAIDWLTALVTHGTASPLVAAIAGAAGTGLYEIQKQVRQQVSTTPSTSPPLEPPK